jgi:hypothetical protein
MLRVLWNHVPRFIEHEPSFAEFSCGIEENVGLMFVQFTEDDDVRGIRLSCKSVQSQHSGLSLSHLVILPWNVVPF